jgi:hypothetical protein
VADGTLLSRSDDGIVCAFDHLTSFGGFMKPRMNELGSVDALFDLDRWANNVLGLVICLSLLLITFVITMWSFCDYVKTFKKTGKTISDKGHSEYARNLVTTSYSRTKLKKLSGFKLRTETQCGPLLWKVQGDPYVRSQRMILVLITVLCSLFFSALFHDNAVVSVCLGGSACTLFACPSCMDLHGVSDCGDFPSPADICGKFVGADTLQAAHSKCTDRPLIVCRLSEGDYVDPVRGDCTAGKRMTVDEHYTGSGGPVSSACVTVPWLSKIGHALFAALCTLPAIAILDSLFGYLRAPHNKVIMDELHMREENVFVKVYHWLMNCHCISHKLHDRCFGAKVVDG